MRATDAILKPDAEASGGSVHWLEDGLPDIRRVGADATAPAATRWIGLAQQRRLSRHRAGAGTAAAAWLALLLIVGALLLAWRLEGR